jgi:hypothetical protein
MAKEALMHGIIRTYKYDKANGDAITAIVKAEFVPLIESHEGFVEYHWIDSGDGEGASMAIFEDKESAEASTFIAGGFVHDRLADMVTSAPHIIEGPL